MKNSLENNIVVIMAGLLLSVPVVTVLVIWGVIDPLLWMRISVTTMMAFIFLFGIMTISQD